MKFHMMTLLDDMGKIGLVRSDFLSQGKSSDILIPCERYCVPVVWVSQPPVIVALSSFTYLFFRYHLLSNICCFEQVII